MTGALGFWSALREVFLGTREQRCWFHKIGNVLSALPKSAHPGAKKALAEIWNAEDREHARRVVAAFKLGYGAKFGKALAKITDDLDKLLTFYDFPAEHWVHLRTTNPIESTFATVRRRTKVTKGPGSSAADLATAYQPPGTLLLAYHHHEPIGCVGLKPIPQPRTIEIKRLYIRPTHRRGGAARTLMQHAHHHAAHHGFNRLVLDIMPTPHPRHRLLPTTRLHRRRTVPHRGARLHGLHATPSQPLTPSSTGI